MVNDEVDQELSDHAEGVYSRHTLQKEELLEQARAGLSVKELLVLATEKITETNLDSRGVSVDYTYVSTKYGLRDINLSAGVS